MSPASIAFLLGLALASAYDLGKRRIPNALNLAILMTGLAIRVHTGTLMPGLAGAGLGLALLLLLFEARWIGGGDVKLVAAIGAWLGPEGVLLATALGFAGAGVYAAAWTMIGGASLRRDVFINLRGAFLGRRVPAVPSRPRAHLVPLALPFAAAAVVVLLHQGGLHG